MLRYLEFRDKNLMIYVISFDKGKYYEYFRMIFRLLVIILQLKDYIVQNPEFCYVYSVFDKNEI